MIDSDRSNLGNENLSTPEARMDDVVEVDMEGVDESMQLKEV